MIWFDQSLTFEGHVEGAEAERWGVWARGMGGSSATLGSVALLQAAVCGEPRKVLGQGHCKLAAPRWVKQERKEGPG